MSSTASTAPDDDGDTATSDVVLGAPYRKKKERTMQQRIIDSQRDELLLLAEERTRLRSREVDISGLTVKVQQQLAETQGQVDRVKSTLRLQLASPITEAEYFRMEQLPEEERDLIVTLKIALFQQLGAIQCSRDAAVKRGAELAEEVQSLTAKTRSLSQEISDLCAVKDIEIQNLRRTVLNLEQRASFSVELNSKVAELESKLRVATSEQEKSMELRVALTQKINELTRVETILRQSEGDVDNYKTQAQCAEQKLEILKSEYYDTRLQYNNRTLELEHALRVAEEKLKMFGDVDLEAEVFMANLASQEDSDYGGGTDASGKNWNQIQLVPPSRRMHHALTVTKRCLSLENQMALLKQDCRRNEEVVVKLKSALEMAKCALNKSNSPYFLMDQALTESNQTVTELREQLTNSREENKILHLQLKERTADVEVLSRHRGELVRIRELLSNHPVSILGSKNSPPTTNVVMNSQRMSGVTSSAVVGHQQMIPLRSAPDIGGTTLRRSETNNNNNNRGRVSDGLMMPPETIVIF